MTKKEKYTEKEKYNDRQLVEKINDGINRILEYEKAIKKENLKIAKFNKQRYNRKLML